MLGRMLGPVLIWLLGLGLCALGDDANASLAESSVHEIVGVPSDYRWGLSVGYGGTGIVNTQVLTNGATGSVPRSEGPLVFSVFIDTLLSDTLGIAFEHSRGVNFLPFSSGVSFTGVVTRWYFFGAAPSMAASPDANAILVKRFVPFGGFAMGLAEANVQRDAGDFAPVVSGSAIFMGFRVGADYPLGQGRGIRPEIAYSTSEYSGMFSSTTALSKPKLIAFSAQCGWYFNF